MGHQSRLPPIKGNGGCTSEYPPNQVCPIMIILLLTKIAHPFLGCLCAPQSSRSTFAVKTMVPEVEGSSEHLSAAPHQVMERNKGKCPRKAQRGNLVMDLHSKLPPKKGNGGCTSEYPPNQVCPIMIILLLTIFAHPFLGCPCALQISRFEFAAKTEHLNGFLKRRHKQTSQAMVKMARAKNNSQEKFGRK